MKRLIPVPLLLADYVVADKAPLWEEITRKYQLRPIPYDRVASWAFGDFIFHSAFDNISSSIKARQARFYDCVDKQNMFAEFFTAVRKDGVLPALRELKT